MQIVFALGVNDSIYLVNENLPRFTDMQFRQNLEILIALAKKIAANISFVGLPPVDDALLNPMPWAPDKAYANAHVKYFEDIVAGVCKQHDLPFLPLFDTWKAMNDYKVFLTDGVHPNSKGHALLAEQIGSFLITEEFHRFHSN